MHKRSSGCQKNDITLTGQHAELSHWKSYWATKPKGCFRPASDGLRLAAASKEELHICSRNVQYLQGTDLTSYIRCRCLLGDSASYHIELQAVIFIKVLLV